MNVRTLCLSILYFGEATGYEIKKMSIEGKYSHFVDASFGSIYPALARLEKDELVTCREESHPGKPPRKIYSITDSGRQAFVEALLVPPEPDIFRSEFLMIAMCAGILTKEIVTRAIETRISQLNDEIDHLEEVRGEKSAAAEPENVGALWAVNYGLTCMRGSLDHLNATRGELEAFAGCDSAPSLPTAAE